MAHMSDSESGRIGASHIKPPLRFQRSKGLSNPQNKDNRCFTYATAAYFAHLDKAHNIRRPSVLEKYFDRFTPPTQYPVHLSHIDSIEDANKHIVYSVFRLRPDGIIEQIRLPDTEMLRQRSHHIRLVLYEHHCLLCTNFSAFINTKSSRGLYCPCCLRRFPRNLGKETHHLDMHMQTCKGPHII